MGCNVHKLNNVKNIIFDRDECIGCVCCFLFSITFVDKDGSQASGHHREVHHEIQRMSWRWQRPRPPPLVLGKREEFVLGLGAVVVVELTLLVVVVVAGHRVGWVHRHHRGRRYCYH